VEGGAALPTLASRRQVEIRDSSTIGGQPFSGSPFAPGVREQYEVDTGEFFPVSLPSESGRAAFISINRGEEFFDRYTHTTESDTLSTTTWNNYTSGAAQCAMRVDVSKVASLTNQTPTEFRFEFYKGGVDAPRDSMTMTPILGFSTTLPRGFKPLGRNEGQSKKFPDLSLGIPEFVDVAYGKPGGYFFKEGVSGTVVFDNATFGDPLIGTQKEGYWRPRKPFTSTMGPNNKVCVGIYPERFPAFLAAIGGDPVEINHSVVVNVDHKAGLYVRKPTFQSENDLALVLGECADLTKYSKGFSLVTNLRMYIGSDFNTKIGTPPTGYTPTGEYYPPASLYAPEKRYGVQNTPYTITLSGQIGSLASESAVDPVRPLDSFGISSEVIDPSRSTVNLRPITHPADLPPITMMNWLILLEERRKEYY
jgi:hypothetical protein